MTITKIYVLAFVHFNLGTYTCIQGLLLKRTAHNRWLSNAIAVNSCNGFCRGRHLSMLNCLPNVMIVNLFNDYLQFLTMTIHFNLVNLFFLILLNLSFYLQGQHTVAIHGKLSGHFNLVKFIQCLFTEDSLQFISMVNCSSNPVLINLFKNFIT